MLQFISSLIAQLRREDEEGQTLVEYGLLLALIAIIVIVANMVVDILYGILDPRTREARS